MVRYGLWNRPGSFDAFDTFDAYDTLLVIVESIIFFCFLLNDYRAWIFIFNIGRSTKMF